MFPGRYRRAFSPSHEHYRDADSLHLLAASARLVANAGARIVNIDATVIAEAPKIGPYAVRMQQAIANTLNLAPARISIKATTNEGMGFAGRGEGIAAIAVANVLMRDE